MYNLFTESDREYIYESNEEIFRFDEAAYNTARSIVSGFQEVSLLMANVDMKSTERILYSAMNDLSTMVEANFRGENNSEVINFLRNICTVNTVTGENVDLDEIVIRVPTVSTTDKIRPQYLEAMLSTMRKNIRKFLAGEIDDVYLMRSTEVPSETDLKRQCCKADVDPNKDLFELAKDVDFENIVVDTDYISSKIIPFLRDMPRSYADINKECKDLLDSLKGMREEAISIDKAVNAANRSITNTSTKIKLNKYVYLMFKRFLNVRSYLIFMMCRKIRLFSGTLTRYLELYNVISERYPDIEKTNLTESFEDDWNMSDDDWINDALGDSSMNILLASNKLGRHAHDLPKVWEGPSNISTNPETPIVDSCKSIINRMKDFFNAIQSGAIFDDAVEVAGFNQSILSMYQDIVSQFAAGPIDWKLDDQWQTASLAYTDLKDFNRYYLSIKRAIKNVEDYIADTYKYLKSIYTSQNIIAPETIDESLTWIDDIDTQFKEYAIAISKAAKDRVLSMDNAINAYTNSLVTTVHVPELSHIMEDTTSDYYQIMSELSRESLHKEFVENAIDYITERAMYNEGLRVLFEDDENNETNNNEGGNDPRSWWQRFKDWWKGWFDKIFKKAQGKSKADAGWLRVNEDTLNNMDMTGMQLEMLPYAEMNFVADATTVLNNIKAYNIASGDAKVPDTIFGNMPFYKLKFDNKTVKNADSNKTKAWQYYKVGNAQPKPKTYAGDELKSQIKPMIDFCKGYEKLTKDIVNIGQNVTNYIDEKMAVNGAGSVTTNVGTKGNEGTVTVNGTKVHEAVDTYINDDKVFDFFFEKGKSNNNQAQSQNQTTQTQSQGQNQTTQTQSQGQNQNTSNGNTTGSTRVEVTNTNDKNDNKEAEVSQSKEANKMKWEAPQSALKALNKCYLDFSGGMVEAIRDRYVSYIGALKGLVKAKEGAQQTSDNANNNTQTQNNSNQQTQQNTSQPANNQNNTNNQQQAAQ